MKRAQILKLLGLKDGEALQAAAVDAARMLREAISGGCAEAGAKECDIPEEKFLVAYRELMMLLFGIGDEQACRVCGCTHYEPCDDGCSWVEADLCSSCVPEDLKREVYEVKPGGRAKRRKAARRAR